MKTSPDVLLIGLGRQGGEHLAAAIELQKEGKLKVVGVCDTNKDYITRKVEDFSLNCFFDYKKAYMQTRPKIAILSLPNFKYNEIRTFFLERGVHVLQEKPLAISLAEAKMAKKLSVKNKCYLRVAQQRRYNPFFILAKKLIKKLGKISFYDYLFTLNDTKYSWYWDKKRGGGAWFGLGWHACFVLHYLLGIPDKMRLTSIIIGNRKWEYKTDDTNIFEGHYESGAVARILTSVVSPNKAEQLLIQGSSGYLVLDRKQLILRGACGKILRTDKVVHSWFDAYKKQLESFVGLVCEQKNKQYFDQADLEVMKMVGIKKS